MVVGSSHTSTSKEETLTQLGEAEILFSVFPEVKSLPALIKSPIRQDNNPSFSIYLSSKNKIRFKDFATGDSGSLVDLLCIYWGCNFQQCLLRLKNLQLSGQGCTIAQKDKTKMQQKTSSRIEVKVRPWMSHDIQYWESYGCNINLLKKAEVYPISHKVIIQEGVSNTFAAPRHSYVFIERKEGRVTKKIYTPFASRFKWVTDNDASVIGLWAKVPASGPILCICSSLKDAICLWSNSGIPCIYIQGEAFRMSDTAVNNLKKRFKKVLICFDNDEAGLIDAQKLSQQTGFINVVLPSFEGGKDISDAYKVMGKEKFKQIIISLFTTIQST